MALSEQQAAVARLSTDAEARALLARDHAAFAAQFQLTEAETEQLRAESETVSDFAAALFRKRLHEASRSIPRTVAMLGPAEFARRFREFAEQTPVDREPAWDAMHFLDWLQSKRNVSRTLRGMARFEQVQGEFRLTAARVRVAWFWHLPATKLAILWRSGGSVHSFTYPSQRR